MAASRRVRFFYLAAALALAVAIAVTARLLSSARRKAVTELIVEAITLSSTNEQKRFAEPGDRVVLRYELT